MGVVLPFTQRAERTRGDGTGLEKELTAAYRNAQVPSNDAIKRPPISSRPLDSTSGGSEHAGLALIVVAVAIFALFVIAAHFGGPQYSARANLLPSAFRID